VLVVTTPFASGRKCGRQRTQAWKDLIEFNINENDVVIEELQPQGTTPYVIGGLQSCNETTLSREASLTTQQVHF
jgi:N-acetylmuramic acid 6-phosphate (MurNAc-6-P) etherase